MAVSDHPDLVVAFYQEQFTRAGWEQVFAGNPLEGDGGEFKKENATIALFYGPGYFELVIDLFGPGAPEFGPVTPPPSP